MIADQMQEGDESNGWQHQAMVSMVGDHATYLAQGACTGLGYGTQKCKLSLKDCDSLQFVRDKTNVKGDWCIWIKEFA